MNVSRLMIGCFMASVMCTSLAQAAVDSVYQWAVPVAPAADQGKRPLARAYLWIPEHCQHVRAVVLGQQNMLEEDILDHPAFRSAMAKLDVAIVWVSPSMDHLVASPESIKRFDAVLQDLATASGYSELATAPVAPIGHSAHATFPWNFAAWAPGRTLGVLSVHGDAPQTPLAGFGPQHIHYTDGALDGVPGLMVMGEYEWIDARWAPATVYRNLYPKAPIALLAEPGEGHFAACDDLVNFCAMFIRKCVEQRLPGDSTTEPTTAPVLKPIDPAAGWLVQRWRIGIGRNIPPAPFASYGGDSVDAFWAFDQEMAEAIQNYHTEMTAKLPELLGFMQDGKLVQATSTHPMNTLKFEPDADGEAFTLQPVFLDAVTTMGGNLDVPGRNNHIRWTHLAAGTPIGHAAGGGPIEVTCIEGPVAQTGPNAFRLQFYRGSAFDKVTAWFAARHPGDDKFKSAVQQAVMNIPRNAMGAEQTITFAAIGDPVANAQSIKLVASSSAGLPVHFFVREGPAIVEGDTLKLLAIPPRAQFPIKVTVVAWQWGRAAEPKIKTASAVEQTFSIKTPG
jgi:hypothetical protein